MHPGCCLAQALGSRQTARTENGEACDRGLGELRGQARPFSGEGRVPDPPMGVTAGGLYLIYRVGGDTCSRRAERRGKLQAALRERNTDGRQQDAHAPLGPGLEEARDSGR